MAELPIETDGTITVVQLIARTNVGGASLIVTALMRHLDPMRFQQVLLRGSCEEG